MAGFGPELAAFTELAPGVRRIVAPNPSMMTGPGTNTYLFGEKEVAVVDPGPRLTIHLENIVEKANAPIRWILATHTHPDHSPGVRILAKMTGASALTMRTSSSAFMMRLMRARGRSLCVLKSVSSGSASS